MTQETPRTDWPDRESFAVQGSLLNMFARAIVGNSGGVRTTGMAVRRGAIDSSCPDLPDRQTSIVRVKNMTDEDRRKYEVMALGKACDPEVNSTGLPLVEPLVEGEAPPGGHCTIAILLSDAKADPRETVDAQHTGVCLALVDIKDTEHRRAFPVADKHVLQSGMAGPVEILWHPDDEDEQLCLVRVGCGEAVTLLVRLPAAGIGAADFHSGEQTLEPGRAECDVWHYDAEQNKRVPLKNGEDPVRVEVLNCDASEAKTGDDNRFAVVKSDDDWEFVLEKPAPPTTTAFEVGVYRFANYTTKIDPYYQTVMDDGSSTGFTRIDHSCWTYDSSAKELTCTTAGTFVAWFENLWTCTIPMAGNSFASTSKLKLWRPSAYEYVNVSNRIYSPAGMWWHKEVTWGVSSGRVNQWGVGLAIIEAQVGDKLAVEWFANGTDNITFVTKVVIGPRM